MVNCVLGFCTFVKTTSHARPKNVFLPTLAVDRKRWAHVFVRRAAQRYTTKAS